MTKNKQQIQDEIAALQKQLEEMERQQYYLFQDGYLTETNMDKLFKIEQYPSIFSASDRPHGLGKFETREEAERCREALIGLLHIAKEHPLTLEFLSNGFYLVARGQRVIKAIEEGTYE